jgi:hypothetical protein
MSYKDKAATVDGVAQFKLAGGDAGKTKAQLKANHSGGELPLGVGGPHVRRRTRREVAALPITQYRRPP